jgi:hypothetical protein
MTQESKSAVKYENELRSQLRMRWLDTSTTSKYAEGIDAEFGYSTRGLRATVLLRSLSVRQRSRRSKDRERPRQPSSDVVALAIDCDHN